MAYFTCVKCDLDFDTLAQHKGHHRLFHQPSYQVVTSNGHAIVNQSLDGRFHCFIDGFLMTFSHNDNLQYHSRAHCARLQSFCTGN